MPPATDFGEWALRLAAALAPAETAAAGWAEQQATTVESLEAALFVLDGLPLPPNDSGGPGHANLLRMLGSMQDLACCAPDELAAHTALDGRTAAAVAAFFQRGGCAPPQPALLPGCLPAL